MATRTYSLSEAAGILGKDRNTLSKWLAQGCPAVTKADRTRGIEWALSIPDIIDWMIDRAVSDVVDMDGGEAGRVSKDEADRRKAVAQAIAEEVGTAELLNSVLNQQDAAADVAAFTVALRTGLSNVSGKIAGRAASMTVPAEIQEFVEAEMNKAFDAAQAELADRWAHAEPDGDGGGGADCPPPGG